MKEPKDKRTKAYKQWKANYDNSSKGLGDVVETITKKTGIKKAVELFTDGKDCGCDKRKERLNKLKFKFSPVRCFDEDTYNKWTEFRKKKDGYTLQDQRFIIHCTEMLFARTFKPFSANCSGCGKKLGQFIDQIDKVYKEYQ